MLTHGMSSPITSNVRGAFAWRYLVKVVRQSGDNAPNAYSAQRPLLSPLRAGVRAVWPMHGNYLRTPGVSCALAHHFRSAA